MVTASYRMTVESIRPLSMIPALSRSSALHGGAASLSQSTRMGPIAYRTVTFLLSVIFYRHFYVSVYFCYTLLSY